MATAITTKERIDEVNERIARAADRAGRSPDEITVVAVGKTHPPEDFVPVIESGIRHFGESRVQEAEEKIPQVQGENLTWHMIGHLQRNKAQNAIHLFNQLHSLDSKRLARRLQRQLEKEAVEHFNTFIQVNTSGEESKYGLDPETVQPLIGFIGEECPRITINGLMTMAPLTDDERRIRRTFSGLRKIHETLNTTPFPNIHLEALSMGMTNDYEIAIEEGATHLRIGRAIFGERLSR